MQVTIPNTLNSVRSTIESLLVDELKEAPAIPVVVYNQDFTPAGVDSYVQCLTSFGSTEYLTIGRGQQGTAGHTNRMVGLLTVNIYTSAGAGPGDNFSIGERIRSLYNRAIVSGVYFDAPIGPEVLAAPSGSGFFHTQVRVTFEFIEEL